MFKLLLTVSILASSSLALASAGVKELTVKQAQEMLDQKQAVFIDVNSAKTFEKNHIPTAMNVKISDVNEKTLPKDKKTNLVFYCANEGCSASQSAGKKALELGYTNVYKIPAGIEGWVKETTKN